MTLFNLALNRPFPRLEQRLDRAPSQLSESPPRALPKRPWGVAPKLLVLRFLPRLRGGVYFGLTESPRSDFEGPFRRALWRHRGGVKKMANFRLHFARALIV